MFVRDTVLEVSTAGEMKWMAFGRSASDGWSTTWNCRLQYSAVKIKSVESAWKSSGRSSRRPPSALAFCHNALMSIALTASASGAVPDSLKTSSYGQHCYSFSLSYTYTCSFPKVIRSNALRSGLIIEDVKKLVSLRLVRLCICNWFNERLLSV